MVCKSDLGPSRVAIYNHSSSCVPRPKIENIGQGFHKILFFVVVFPAYVERRIDQKQNVSIKVQRYEGGLGS